jgi:YidC/Oxa1 family membrane protein insertase
MDRRSFLFLLAVTTSFLLVNYWFDSRRQEYLATHQVPKEPEKKVIETPPPPPRPETSEYFVIESPYQQVILSSTGGAITEINLPFKSTQSPKSVVLPIAADSELVARAPNVCRFPFVNAKDAQGKVIPQTLGGFYPLLRRPDGLNTENTRFIGAVLSSQYPEFSSLPFQVVSHTNRSITFEANQPHRKIRKTFAFPKDIDRYPYCLDVSVAVIGDAKDLWITTGVPEAEWLAGSHGAALKYRLIKNGTGTVTQIDLPKTSFSSMSLQPDWICNSNGFFGIILDPIKGNGVGVQFSKVPDTILPTRLSFLAKNSPDLPGYIGQLPLSPTESSSEFRLFAGPFADSVLTTIDTNSLKDQHKPTNYLACQTFHGWFSFISEPFAKFLFFIMKNCHKIFGSWALCIVLATVVLRILMYPLNRWSMRSMRAMQEIAPLVRAIQEKHKKDPTKAQMEIMGLYRERKVNPFSGCLPLLIQMPFLIGMFDLLRSTYELRGAVFIPGWINDLSAPDVLFSWGFHIPLLGSNFHLLPIVLGVIMWIQQKMSTNLPKDPRDWTDQQRQQHFMANIMALVMTVMFYQFPSGLNIYWISSMALGILQQWWTNRHIQVPSKR